jgi:DNA-binding beta-propeller fold protein YncE
MHAARESVVPVTARRSTARAFILPMTVAIVAAVGVGSVNEGGMAGRLIAFDAFPPADAMTCEWEVAALDALPAAGVADGTRAQFLQRQGGQGRGGRQAEIPPLVPTATSTRQPLRFIQDTNAVFSAVTVDTARNEVILTDENRFRVFVYDRLANSGPAARTEPKRVIGGLSSATQYQSSVYVDPATGDIYATNNDTVHEVSVFPRTAQGDVRPARTMPTVYGSFGVAADEERQELFYTVQHSGAVMVFDKKASARANDVAVRMILGKSTQMADPHGIAFDAMRKVIYVANWGTSREFIRDPKAGRTEYTQAAVPGSGKFVPPSITVYPSNADQDVAPLRVIQGPKTGLDWPTNIAVDAKRGELYVANSGGHSVLVFDVSAQGDVAPIRVLKGARTELQFPTGVFFDAANDEVWVANFGGHAATVFARDARGDVAPKRVIRSAPRDEPTPGISNPYNIAYDPGREEVIVPSCVANPQIGMFSRTADKAVAPTRRIAGQNSKLNRTVHGVNYDEVHDEIFVSSQIAQAVLAFSGTQNGNVAPIRIIQGLRTQISVPEMVEVDPVHNELFVPARDKVLVFNRTDSGNVAPKRTLNWPASRVAVDYVHNLLVVSGRGQIAIFAYDAAGDTKPLRTIGGPKAQPMGGMRHGFDVHSATGMILVSVPFGESTGEGLPMLASDQSFVAIWSVFDSGDVAPRWRVGGPQGALRNPRGVAVDAKNKTLLVSDKYLNGVLTFSLPEMFEPATPRTSNTAE